MAAGLSGGIHKGFELASALGNGIRGWGTLLRSMFPDRRTLGLIVIGIAAFDAGLIWLDWTRTEAALRTGMTPGLALIGGEATDPIAARLAIADADSLYGHIATLSIAAAPGAQKTTTGLDPIVTGSTTGAGFSASVRPDVVARHVAADLPWLFGGSALAFVVMGAAMGPRRRRALAEPALLAKSDWMQRVAETAPAGIAIWDAEGQLTGQSRAMVEMFGDTLADLPASAHPQPGQWRERVQLTDERAAEISYARQSDGSLIAIALEGGTGSPSAPQTGADPGSYQALARRLVEEKSRAEAANRSKTAFLTHLSHDIRTPLNHIIGFADLITHQPYGPIGDTRYATYVTDIKASGEKLLDSFTRIFELAEMEEGKTPMRVAEISANAFFGSLIEKFAERAKQAGIELVVSIPDELTILGDEHCLSRMMGNLIDNALKFTRKGGRVTLTAWAAEDGIVLEVTDTGIGIAEDRLALLAQPFLIGASAFDKSGGGAPGFGLALARGIAEISGGSLVLDSTPGIGTTVAVALPRNAPGHLTGQHAA